MQQGQGYEQTHGLLAFRVKNMSLYRKEAVFMILAITLALIAIVLITFVALTVVAGGASFVILFSDVIVCIFIIVWIIKRLFRKR